jgi:cobalt-zinc-cadmium efflux system membrane fusion protein
VNTESQTLDSHAEPGGAAAPSVAPNAAPKSNRRWLFIAGGVVALGTVGFFLLSGNGGPAPTPAAAADTPRVEGPNIRFSKAFAERSGVKLAPAVKATLVPVVTAVGTMDFDPEYVAAVGARLRGLVTRVEKFEGDKVDVGTVLAVIESSELGEAQAAVATLQAEKRAADLNLEREQELAEKRLSTAREAEVAGVEAQRYASLLSAAQQKVAALAGSSRSTRLGSHELRSPLAGTVVARSVAPGQTVEGEIVAFRIANTEHLWVGLDVFEKNIALVQVGDKVDLSPLAAPAEAFEGRVARVGAVIDPDTNAAYVRVEIDNKDGHLRAGQAVNARIHASARGTQESTLIPTTAITFVDGKPTVFISTGEGSVKVANVETGFTDGPQTEVKSGVKAGDTVVSEGVFALKSELFR